MKDKKVNIDTSEYSNIYVTSDIHGHYNEFLAMLDKIEFSNSDLLVVIGDTIDRGYANLAVLKHCLQAENIVLLMGNHEKMMTSIITNDRYELAIWKQRNGGSKTNREINSLKYNDYQSYKELMSKVYNLPHYMEIDINDKKYLLVHAGIRGMNISNDIDELMAFQGEEHLWVRKDFLKSKVEKPFTIIFGHTGTYTIQYEIDDNYPDHFTRKGYNESKIIEEAKKSKIWYSNNKIGLDCGLYSGGKLACLRLNDMKEFYVDKIIN